MSSASTNDALLTVFQADPLAYLDTSGYHPVPVLDFESERQLLTDSLTDVTINVDVTFDIATTERLGRFLAKGEGRVLHFSCHGHPEFLAIENGWGAMHMLPVDDLRDLIQAGGESLKFVFVSACYSRSAGEAFLQAGVKHVVCCQQDDQPILNLSSVLFARAFYQALANGRVLRHSFDLARQQVLNCAHLDRSQRLKEAEKFVLLPEGADHNVTIFEQSYTNSCRPQTPPSSLRSSRRVLPVPPHIFTGRQVETFRVLDALKSARVVRVTGAVGVGKGSVVQKVCRYIQERQDSCMSEIGEILWLPTVRMEAQDDVSEMLTAFCAVFNSSSVNDEESYNQCHQQLLNYLFENKALLVIDARKAQSPQCVVKIASFLHDVIYHTNHTRVIIIHHIGASIMPKLPCKERDVYLHPLDVASTVRLFGKLCQHVADRRYKDVSNSTELCNLLLPEGSPTDKPRSRRGRDIFRMVGEGVPANVHHAAKSMSGEEYDRMISLGLRKEQVLEYGSRAALEKELSELSMEVTKAVEEKRWGDATECQHRLDEMEILRETLHDLPTLKSLAKSLEADLQLASSARDFSSCARLQEELDAILEKIRIEKLAMEELGVEEEDFKLPAQEEEKKQETRVDLELQISALDRELEKACDGNDFGLARKLDSQMKSLQELRSSLPTRDELIAEMKDLQSSLKQAKDARDWDLAEALYAKVQGSQKRIDAESQALSLLSNEDAQKATMKLNPAKPGAVAVQPTMIASEAPQPAAEPQGDHVNEIEEEPDLESMSQLPVALAVTSSTAPKSAQSFSSMQTGSRPIQDDDDKDEPMDVDYAYSATSLNPSHPLQNNHREGDMSRLFERQGIRPEQAARQIGRAMHARANQIQPSQRQDLQTSPDHLPPEGELGVNSSSQIQLSSSSLSQHQVAENERRTDQPPPSNPLVELAFAAELHQEEGHEELAFAAAVHDEADSSPYFGRMHQAASNVQMHAPSRGSDPPAAGMFPGRMPQFRPMAMGDGYDDAFDGMDLGGVPRGHTNRLVLEQMIQESISNMAVSAVKVEPIGDRKSVV